jgi:sortase (surface protein transpeptidase)
MRHFTRGWSPRAAATTLAIILAVAGITATAVGYANRQKPPPRPSAAAAGTITPSTAPPSPATSTARATASPTGVSATRPTTPSQATRFGRLPIAISIPSIGVQSPIVGLGLNADGTVEVPTSFHEAGWYKYGVEPGQNGPSVYLGHADSVSGPGVFYKLGALRPGAHVVVQRADGKLVTFVITGVRQYSKTAFPTLDVYADTPIPTIRLVTCGGAFDSATHHYLSNIVAFGQLA